MTCLFCNKPMISGFIQERAEAYFTEKPHKLLFAAKSTVSRNNARRGKTLRRALHCGKGLITDIGGAAVSRVPE